MSEYPILPTNTCPTCETVCGGIHLSGDRGGICRDDWHSVVHFADRQPCDCGNYPEMDGGAASMRDRLSRLDPQKGKR